MAKKRETQVVSLNPTLECIQILVKNDQLQARILSLQNELQQFESAPSVEQQRADIAQTFDKLDDQPLSKLQLIRLNQQAKNNDLADLYQPFNEIISPLIQVTAESRRLIDPYCKSERDYSSRVNHYKKWLVNVFFIYLFYFSEELQRDPHSLTEYLSFIHRIYAATTTSRVTLRQAPNVQAEALLELPRNSIVKVFGRLINSHWVKVIYEAEQNRSEGYMQAVYLKLPQGYKIES